MSLIREDDVIASVADALQYISYYHSPDFIRAMGRAYAVEQSPAARDAIAQILTNSRLCAEGHRPICQDTGIVVVFVQVGMGVRWDTALDLRRDDQRRRASRLSGSRQQAACLHRVRSGVQAPQHARQHAGGDPHGIRAGRAARDHGRRQGRRLREQIHVRDAESVRFGRGLGGGGGTGDGSRLVSAGHARCRHRRQRREGHAAGEEIPDGAHRYRRPASARRAQRTRGAASGDLPARQRSGGRRARARRPHHGARREGARLSDARRVAAGRRHTELRRHAPRSFHARRIGACGARAAESRAVAEGALDRRCGRTPRVARRVDSRGNRNLAGRASGCCCRAGC